MGSEQHLNLGIAIPLWEARLFGVLSSVLCEAWGFQSARGNRYYYLLSFLVALTLASASGNLMCMHWSVLRWILSGYLCSSSVFSLYGFLSSTLSCNFCSPQSSGLSPQSPLGPWVPPLSAPHLSDHWLHCLMPTMLQTLVLYILSVLCFQAAR